TTSPGDTHLKLGEEKTVVLTVRRDKNFTQPITLKADSQNAKVSAHMDKTKVDGSDSSVTLTVKADKDAPSGTHIIKVTGTPAQGQPTSLDVKVDVSAS
ncbi:MAG TPA: hypothetical protein VH092_27060, partial [Urbifossiella sp.]|nr:hypothetical protein [Urbifossiella sp.]